MRKERDLAATSRKDEVARKPQSLKSAISLSMPVGTSRKQEHRRVGSPERTHIFVNNPAAIKEAEKIKNDSNLSKEEQADRLNKLRQMYGDASTTGGFKK